jgi:hypothetical protein
MLEPPDLPLDFAEVVDRPEIVVDQLSKGGVRILESLIDKQFEGPAPLHEPLCFKRSLQEFDARGFLGEEVLFPFIIRIGHVRLRFAAGARSALRAAVPWPCRLSRP